MFYDNFMLLCKKSDIKPYTALRDIGIESNSILSRWRQGSTPRLATVKQIANYFGVTPEELLFGEKKETTNEMTAEKAEILKKIQKMSSSEVRAVLAFVNTLDSMNKEKED